MGKNSWEISHVLSMVHAATTHLSAREIATRLNMRYGTNRTVDAIRWRLHTFRSEYQLVDNTGLVDTQKSKKILAELLMEHGLTEDDVNLNCFPRQISTTTGVAANPIFSDPTMVNLIPPVDRANQVVLPSDLICRDSQMTANVTEGSPRLRASPGDKVSLFYQENGHVTLPDVTPGKPPGAGLVYVYGTSKAQANDTLLSIHKVWNEDGTGGNGQGELLGMRSFDDGRCYQINPGPISKSRQMQYPHVADSVMGADQWCEIDVKMPITDTGIYTLYWVWDWPTAPGAQGFPNAQGSHERMFSLIEGSHYQLLDMSNKITDDRMKQIEELEQLIDEKSQELMKLDAFGRQLSTDAADQLSSSGTAAREKRAKQIGHSIQGLSIEEQISQNTAQATAIKQKLDELREEYKVLSG
ncbi:MAG: hypothetical protein M1824_005951 [Vezdaea acicularis]|nr:MAG: hypothetical protein M1824_005951 [Vezdaea acicularis]